MTNPDPDAVARAKADLVEFERKINALMSEESRLGLQRLQLEHARDRIRAFIEMYQHYTGDDHAEAGDAEEVETQRSKAISTEKPIKPQRSRVRLRLDRKPAGIPPMPEMITIAIKVAADQGIKGLEPSQMTKYIRHKWWPNVKGEFVGPIAWRMARNGQLKKEGSVYKLP